jgi:DNA-binding NarL/FixJ family response regulator
VGKRLPSHSGFPYLVQPSTQAYAFDMKYAAKLFALEDNAMVMRGLKHMAGTIRNIQWMCGARDLPEALDYLQTHQPDIAILDLELPGGSGIQAVYQLHQQAPHCRIAVFSGKMNGEVSALCKLAGATKCFHKLTDVDRLNATLRCWAQEFQATQEHPSPTPSARATATPYHNE